MASKSKPESKLIVLKGQEAEDKILEYLKRMNRPYGAVDVSANLKGVVPKAATQKILVALAEKGELVQKTYGKTTFFVVNQANMEAMPPAQIAILEAELKSTNEEIKALAAEVKAATAALAKLKTSPTDAELEIQIAQLDSAISKAAIRLQPLRSGAPLISPEEIEKVNADWTKWRAEWIWRKKVFKMLWNLATDALPPQDAIDLGEDLGIEMDTAEHVMVEQGPLCAQKAANTLKRKRH